MVQAKFWTESYAPGVPKTLQIDSTETFLSALEESIERYRDRVAFSALGAEWTYQRLDTDAKAFAASLHQQGVKPGDRIAIMMPSLPQYMVAILGILRVGGIVVSVNPLYTARELHAQLNDSGATTIILLEQFAAVLQEVVENTPVQRVIITSIGDLYGPLKKHAVNLYLRKIKHAVPSWSMPNVLNYSTLITRGKHYPSVTHVPVANDTAMLQYTGGTTGLPKGAMLTQRNLLAAARISGVWLQPVLDQPPTLASPVFLIPLPLYHVYTLYVCCSGLFCGAQMELVPNPRDLDSLIAAMKRTRFDVMIGINTLYTALLNHPDIAAINFQTTRACVAGGAPTSQGTAERWKQQTNCDILEGWGMTETTGAGMCNPYPSAGFNGSVGLPLPAVDIEIRDEAGMLLPLDEPGEIWIKGPTVMAGYWQQPEATAQVMDEQGFMATGDVGTINKAGFVTLVDRKKDVVLVSGFNVYPTEIEDVLSRMDGVAESVAIGIPDEKTGEAVKLFVVSHDPALTVQAVHDFCTQHLTNYKRPKQIVFLDALPKSTVGKVLRKDLRKSEREVE